GRHIQSTADTGGGETTVQTSPRESRRPRQAQQHVVRQRRGGHGHRVGVEVVGDRGGGRTGDDRDRVVGRIPGGHRQRAGQRAGRDIPDQAAHHLGRRSYQRQRRIVGKRRCVDRDRIAGTAGGDRGGRRTGGNGYAVVGGIARGHRQCAGERAGIDIADQAAHHLGGRAGQGQRRVLRQRRGIRRHRIAG